MKNRKAYGDMMVVLMAIFIVVFTFSISTYANEKYSVSFDGNGVLYTDNVTVKTVQLEAGQLQELQDYAGTMMGNLSNNARDNKKEYMGWSISPTSKEQINFSNYTLNGNVTFYAIWEDAVYVTWDGNGVPLYYATTYDQDGKETIEYRDSIVRTELKGKPISSIPNQDPDPQYSSFDPEKDKRKILRGWSNDGTENNMIKIYSSDPRPIVNEDVTYKAVWYDAAYITWDGNGGKIKGDYTTDNQKVLSIDGDKKTWKYPIGTYLNYMLRQRDFESVPANKVLKGWSLDGTEKTMVEFHDAETLKKYGMDYVLFGTKYLIKDDVTFIAVWGDPDVQEELESETEKSEDKPIIPLPEKPIETPVSNEANTSGGGGGLVQVPSTEASETTPSAETPETTPSTETPETTATAENPVPVQGRVTIPKKPSSVTVKSKDDRIVVSWKAIKKTKNNKKLIGKIKSIQVQYTTDPTFTKNVKTKKVDKKKEKTTLPLKKGKTYYIRVRYVGANGVSKWSKIEKINVK